MSTVREILASIFGRPNRHTLIIQTPDGAKSVDFNHKPAVGQVREAVVKEVENRDTGASASGRDGTTGRA